MNNRYRRLNELLMCIDRRRKQIGEIAMGELDIQPSQHFVLVWLRHMGRAASQSKLAEMMQVSPASVARNLKALDREGYIVRSGGTDGRCNETEITEKGEAMLTQSLELFRQLDARCFANFTPEELGSMEVLLKKLLDNMNQIKNEKEMNA